MTRVQFDVGAFYAALDSQRQSQRLTWKQVAEESGVSASTLTRMAQGRRPDVDSLAGLLKWSGLKAESFVSGDTALNNSSDSLTQITTYLRADRNLTPEGAAALEAIIKAGYESLRHGGIVDVNKKQKLELTWIGKEHRPKLEPRILLEDAEKSYHATQRVGENDRFENRLIFGDNLLALKALEAEFTGKVKCVFIDPPYNTGNAFTHYVDRLEHPIWLSMMRDRLEIIRKLLTEDGSLWITIDDNEAHYLKILCDEVFGRSNFIASVIWRKNYAPKSNARHFSVDHDYVLIFSKNSKRWLPNLISRSDKQNAIYKNPDSDPRGLWRPDNLSAGNPYSLGLYSITTPGGRLIEGPPKGRYWAISEEKFFLLDKDNRIWWGKDGNNVPALKRFLNEVKQGRVPQTYWDYEESGHTQDAKKEIVALFGDDVFGTPKPEKLIRRVLEIATNPNDLILDSFAGSGTTGAVAHKMNRRWIMIELGDHCHTHIIPRLQKVINGEDKGGITQAVNWQGGGGFCYYRLAPSLLQQDQ
jgi:adenine-specific DNA-methyltransferase